MEPKDNYSEEEIKIAKEMKKTKDKIIEQINKRYCKDEKQAKEWAEKRRERLGI